MRIQEFRKILFAMLAVFAVVVFSGCSSTEESSDISEDTPSETPSEGCDAPWEQDREGCK